MLLANSGSIHVFKVRGMSEPGYEAAYIARRCREVCPAIHCPAILERIPPLYFL